MAIDHKIIRNSENFKGLDKRSSDLARTMEYSTDMKNAAYRKTGAINKRKGYKTNAVSSSTFFGTSSFRKINSKDGSVKDELLAVNTKLNKLIDKPLNISYNGSGDVFVSLIVDANEFVFEVKNQDSLLLEKKLGTGLNLNDLSVNQLATAINQLEFEITKLPDSSYYTRRRDSSQNLIYTDGTKDANGNLNTSTTQTSSFNKFIYDISAIPLTYVGQAGAEENTKENALEVGRLVKIFDGVAGDSLEVHSLTRNLDINDNITSFNVVLFGTSFVLNNQASAYLNTAIQIREEHELVATASSIIASEPAALMDAIKDVSIDSSANGGTDLSVRKWEEVGRGDGLTSNLFSWELEGTSVLNLDEVENATFAQINDVMYISNGYDDLMKYDGESVYKAGLPAPTFTASDFVLTSDSTDFIHDHKANTIRSVSVNTNDTYNANLSLTVNASAVSPSGGLSAQLKVETDDQGYVINIDIVDGGNGFAKDDTIEVTLPGNQNDLELNVEEIGPSINFRTFEYRVVYEYTDAQGNTITSQPSDPIVKVVNPQHKTVISFPSDLGLAGRDTTKTFNNEAVDAEGNITLVQHPQYNLLGDLPGSPDRLLKYRTQKRMRVLIYRSIGYNPKSPDLEVVGNYYKIADLPVDYSTTFIDDLKDDDVQNDFLALNEPIKRHDPPPKGKYITAFKNCLVVAGDIKNVNNVAYSLPNNSSTQEIGSEYFPDDDNSVIVDSPFGDKITAIAPLRDLLYVFHRNSVNVIAGQINLLELPVVQLLTREGGVGCLSHHSIEELQNQLIFLSEQGIYAIDASSSLVELSSLVAPLFRDPDLVKKRAITINWTNENLILFHIPKEAVGNTIYTSINSLILVYDYYKKAWLKWTNIDMAAGAANYQNNLFFIDRNVSSSNLKSMSNSNSTFDFNDHEQAVDFEYQTNWESLGEVTVPKKFLRLKCYAFDTDKTFESPGFKVDVAVEHDYVPFELGTINLDFGRSAGAGWGIEPWGEFRWGSVAASFIKTKLNSKKAKSLKLIFKNNTQSENILITNYELEIAAPYRQEIKD